MRTVAFCEIDPYCQAVLRKHWPTVPIFGDVRNLRAEHVGAVDVICGGFPCQDISLAGKGAGLTGERSGLWSEYRRLIEEARPSWVIVENVSALRSRGLDQVLGSLAAIGYDAEWHCIPASAAGAPHRRDRIWIVAHADCQGEHAGAVDAEVGGAPQSMADAAVFGCEGQRGSGEEGAAEHGETVAHSSGHGLDQQRGERGEQEGPRLRWREFGDGGWWDTEPDVGRVANGVSSRMDRLRALGNAVVPQIVEAIGRAIMNTTHDDIGGEDFS